MILDKQRQSTFTPRPKSFAALMDMYEANYIHLRLLCGDIRNLPDETISHTGVGTPVQIKILERASHTTILMITYLFDDGEKRPDLVVQVYHDSRQADVISRACGMTKTNISAWESSVDNVLLCRWRLNRFLYKWINYLQHQGHHFKK